MDWVLAYCDRAPLLATLVTASSSELNFAAVIGRGGNMFLVDTEENYSLKLCKAALSFCCGSEEEINGIGSVMRVAPGYELEGPKKAVLLPNSSPAAAASGSRASANGRSSKKSLISRPVMVIP